MNAGQIILSLVGVAFFFGCIQACEEARCASRAEKMGFQSEYGMMDGCMIRVDRRWVPMSSYRVMPE